MAEVRATLQISGRVQGVWFRQSTKQQAELLAVRGWVRNASDGSVQALFEGDKPAVEALVDWCRTGPELARVDNLQIDWQAATGEFRRFEVIN